MGISEKKMQLVINNYFKQECDANTSIREAFEKGFRIGVKKASSAQPGWIPCSKKLPEEPFACLVTVWDTNPVTMDEFENVLPYFVGWDGEQWNDADGEQCPFEVIAWQPQPTPYREGGQDG